MKFDWNAPFAGAFGLALFIALILFGALIGMSIMVLSQAVTGDRLLSLWGPATGAGIGASATIVAAIYNQERIERREQRSLISRVSYALAGLEGRLSGLQIEVTSAIEQAELGNIVDLTSVMHAANAAFDQWQQISPPHELPSETQALVFRALETARPPDATRLWYMPPDRSPGSPGWLQSATDALADIIRGREAVVGVIKRLGHLV